MNEECLICKAPLEYLLEDVEMECSICRRKERSKTRCTNGHYVCSACHTAGIDSIFVLSGEGVRADIEKFDIHPTWVYQDIKRVWEDMR